MFVDTRSSHHRGFTLIELLLTITVIAILSGITIVAINPIKQFLKLQEVGNAYRAEQLQKAIFQYLVDRNGFPGDGNIPECTESDKNTCAKPICRYGKTPPGGCVNIDVLIPRYIACMPFDAAEVNVEFSGYKIYVQAGRGNVFPASENENQAAGGGCEPFPDATARYALDESNTASPAADAMDNFAGTYAGADKPTPSTDVPSSAEFAFSNPRSSTFDGDDHIVIPVGMDVPGNDLTITAWIKMSSVAEATIIAKASSETLPVNTWWQLGVDTSGSLRLRVSDGVSATDYSRGSVDANRWTHVAGTYNGDRMCLFIDGERLGCQSNSTGLRKGAASVWIGDTPANAGGTNHFQGWIDDVRIYPLPLSEGQIEVIATGGV